MLSFSRPCSTAQAGSGRCTCGGRALSSLIEGGAQERGKRAGTENLPGVAGMAAALTEACAPGANAAAWPACATGSSRAFPGSPRRPEWRGQPWLPGNGTSVSRASRARACCFCWTKRASRPARLRLHLRLAGPQPCPVGHRPPPEVAHGSLRLTLNEENTQADVDEILRAVPQVVGYPGKFCAAWTNYRREKSNMLYSEKVMDHFQHPRNLGKMEDADGIGEVGNAKCGDIMRMYIKVKTGSSLM